MSDFPVGSRKADFQTAPRAKQTNGPEGQVAVLAVSTTAIAVDLTKGFSQLAYDKTKGADPKSPSFNYLTVIADVDIGIIFGPDVASVSSGNAPVLATTGSLTGNTYTAAAGTCFKLKADFGMRFLCQQGQDNALGIVATGNGIVRIYQSSPSNA